MLDLATQAPGGLPNLIQRGWLMNFKIDRIIIKGFWLSFTYFPWEGKSLFAELISSTNLYLFLGGIYLSLQNTGVMSHWCRIDVALMSLCPYIALMSLCEPVATHRQWLSWCHGKITARAERLSWCHGKSRAGKRISRRLIAVHGMMSVIDRVCYVILLIEEIRLSSWYGKYPIIYDGV